MSLVISAATKSLGGLGSDPKQLGGVAVKELAEDGLGGRESGEGLAHVGPSATSPAPTVA